MKVPVSVPRKPDGACCFCDAPLGRVTPDCPDCKDRAYEEEIARLKQEINRLQKKIGETRL